MVWPTLGSRTAKEQEQPPDKIALFHAIAVSLKVEIYGIKLSRSSPTWTGNYLVKAA